MDDFKHRETIDPCDLFVQRLLSKKQEIEKVIEGMKEDRKASEQYRSSDDFFEEIDRAYNETSTLQYYNLLERKYSELARIGALLSRVLKNDDFGWCEECGDKINIERLFVIPDATRCISCQRMHEKMESRKGPITKEIKKPKRDDAFEDGNIREGQDLKAFIGNIDNEPLSFEDLEDMDLTGNFSRLGGTSSSPRNGLR
jgi:DnaK suppressor protein